MKLKLIAPSNIPISLENVTDTKLITLYPKYALLLLSALTPSDWEVKIVDETIEDDNIDEPVDLVGITVATSRAYRAYKIAEIYRAKNVKVILGGIHVSILPNEAIQYADAVVIGESEYTWPILLEDFKKGNLKKFYYAPKTHHLVDLPVPRRDLLKRKFYDKPDTVETSRGCPFDCEYCCSKFFGQNYRFRPIENVINEISTLEGNYVVFLDDNIIGNKQRAKELFEGMIPLCKKWTAQSTIDIVDDKALLNLAQKSGCTNLMIGFDTLNTRNLSIINKRFNDVKRYSSSIKILQDYGVRVVGHFIFGFDEDDDRVFDSTLEFVNKNKIHLPLFWLLTPYPGTRLYTRLKAEGRIFDSNWENYDSRHVTFKPNKMSPEKLHEGYQLAYREVTSLYSIARRTFNFQKHFVSRVKYNLFTRKMAQSGFFYYIE
ncbi:B12-binding domain-containing radical SAM protein [Candidatus Gottesmanbacteria bacterium]|nr:B12-binding domain-containing radical SAM protein [Candidatus Gottesmanbacteria bacterium]